MCKDQIKQKPTWYLKTWSKERGVDDKTSKKKIQNPNET
jgi:hypothetical protein